MAAGHPRIPRRRAWSEVAAQVLTQREKARQFAILIRHVGEALQDQEAGANTPSKSLSFSRTLLGHLQEVFEVERALCDPVV